MGKKGIESERTFKHIDYEEAFGKPPTSTLKPLSQCKQLVYLVGDPKSPYGSRNIPHERMLEREYEAEKNVYMKAKALAQTLIANGTAKFIEESELTERIMMRRARYEAQTMERMEWPKAVKYPNLGVREWVQTLCFGYVDETSGLEGMYRSRTLRARTTTSQPEDASKAWTDLAVKLGQGKKKKESSKKESQLAQISDPVDVVRISIATLFSI